MRSYHINNTLLVFLFSYIARPFRFSLRDFWKLKIEKIFLTKREPDHQATYKKTEFKFNDFWRKRLETI